MRTAIIAFITALAFGLGAFGAYPGLKSAWAEEPAVQKEEADLAALAEQCRWMELLAAASEASANNATDPGPVEFKLKHAGTIRCGSGTG